MKGDVESICPQHEISPNSGVDDLISLDNKKKPLFKYKYNSVVICSYVELSQAEAAQIATTLLSEPYHRRSKKQDLSGRGRTVRLLLNGVEGGVVLGGLLLSTTGEVA